ncbi:hypothetical protein TWF281_002040 [Arthrobotrys megalospora]
MLHPILFLTSFLQLSFTYPLNGPQLETTTPNPLKRAPPNGWWAETIHIYCPPADFVRTRWSQVSFPSEIGPLRSGDYGNLGHYLTSRPYDEAIRYIDAFRRDCEECECMTGIYDGGGNSLLRPPPVLPERSGCETQEKANSCMHLYGCICERTLYEKDDPGIEAGIFGKLNEPFIPPEPKREKGRPRNSKDFNPMKLSSILEDSVDGGFEFPSHRMLVPGTKEPYWLEGPDTVEKDAWNQIPDLAGLIGIGGGKSLGRGTTL